MNCSTLLHIKLEGCLTRLYSLRVVFLKSIRGYRHSPVGGNPDGMVKLLSVLDSGSRLAGLAWNDNRTMN